MSNQCDLKETKEIALKKFFEYAQNPGDWEKLKPSDYWYDSGRSYYKHKYSKFKVVLYLDIQQATVFLDDYPFEFATTKPTERDFATLKSGELHRYTVPAKYWSYTLQHKTKDTRVWKPLTKAQRAKYEVALRKYDNCPIRAAIKNIVNHFKAVENERLCEKMRLDMGLKPINPQAVVNNGYDPEPNSVWPWIKNWWKGRNGDVG
jgi:hypothetical protein